MFKVTFNYFFILGLKVDIERLFNIAREILGLQQALISLKTLRALILLKDYIC